MGWYEEISLGGNKYFFPIPSWISKEGGSHHSCWELNAKERNRLHQGIMVEYNDNDSQEEELSHVTSQEGFENKIKDIINFIKGRGDIEEKDLHNEELENNYPKFEDVVLAELSHMLQIQILEDDLQEISHTHEIEGNWLDRMN